MHEHKVNRITIFFLIVFSLCAFISGLLALFKSYYGGMLTNYYIIIAPHYGSLILLCGWCIYYAFILPQSIHKRLIAHGLWIYLVGYMTSITLFVIKAERLKHINDGWVMSPSIICTSILVLLLVISLYKSDVQNITHKTKAHKKHQYHHSIYD